MIEIIGFTSRNRSVEAKGELNVARGSDTMLNDNAERERYNLHGRVKLYN